MEVVYDETVSWFRHGDCNSGFVSFTLVDETKVDMQVAMRFFYNSEFYASLPEEISDVDMNTLYAHLKQEFECAR